MKKALLICLLVLTAYEGNATSVHKRKQLDEDIDRTRRIEFAFVLLPDESQMTEVKKLAENAQAVVDAQKYGTIPPIMQHYTRKIVNIPHVSVGQYAMLALDLENACSIVNRVSSDYRAFTEKMNPHLVATDENVFFDVAAIREETNPKITALYKALREDYFKSIPTQSPIDQALFEKSQNLNNPEELALIQQFFQNWGTPENNRIRPHFTLSYNHCADQNTLSKALTSIEVPTSLREISFSRLGIAQIDFWGNPSVLLHEVTLASD